MTNGSKNNLVIPSRAAARARRAAHGFTFVELCFALIVTAMVVGAVASLSLAMSTSWRRTKNLESLTLRARQATARMSDEIRNGKLLCTSRAGSLDGSVVQGAAALIWTSDTNGDGKIQGAELTLIEHDVSTHKLMIYRAGQGDAVQVLPWAVVSDPAVITQFKTGRTGLPLVSDVRTAYFALENASSTTQQPMLEFTLSFQLVDAASGGLATLNTNPIYTEYGSSVIRAPLTKPS